MVFHKRNTELSEVEFMETLQERRLFQGRPSRVLQLAAKAPPTVPRHNSSAVTNSFIDATR